MNKLFLTLIACFAAVSTLQAHCGTCSVDEINDHGSDGHAGCSGCAQAQVFDYFSTQEGLAGDDLAAAKKGASAFLTHAESMACSTEEDSCCSAELDAATAIKDASSIAQARVAFKSWSDALLAKMEKSGMADGEAYVMHCPMAFDNKGGTWLQKSSALRNPYYGAMMLTCGMQKSVISASASCCADGSGKACCDGGSCEKCEAKKDADHGHSH